MNLKQRIDGVDWHILRELQTSARISFAELGRRVGLSSPAVAERVQKLEESGVITGYRAVVDPARVGFPISAIVRLRVTGNIYQKTIKAIRNLPEVVECHHTTGNDCLIMRILFSSVTHMEGVLNRLSELGEPTTAIVLSSPVTGRVIDDSMLAELAEAS